MFHTICWIKLDCQPRLEKLVYPAISSIETRIDNQTYQIHIHFLFFYIFSLSAYDPYLICISLAFITNLMIIIIIIITHRLIINDSSNMCACIEQINILYVIHLKQNTVKMEMAVLYQFLFLFLIFLFKSWNNSPLLNMNSFKKLKSKRYLKCKSEERKKKKIT